MWSAQPPSPLYSGHPGSPLLGLCRLLWFWVWAGFSPQSTTGQLPVCSALRLGLELMPSPLRASFVFGAGLGVLCLSCSRFLEGSQSTQYRSALRYSFQCFLGFFLFFWGLWTLCFLISFASWFREHLTIVCIWLLGWPQAKLGSCVWVWGGTLSS